MKILHVAKKYPDALGGDAVVVSNLRQHQRAAGHTVHILTSNCVEVRRDDQLTTCGLRDRPEALDAITPRRLLSLLLLFFQSFTVLGRVRPDIIHTHSIDMAFVVSWAARLFHIPILHTFHIVTFHDRSQSALRRHSEIWLAKLAGLQVVTAPNQHDVVALQRAGIRRAVVLPNGVDVDFWYPHPQPHDIFTIVTVGRLEAQKGYSYLVKAVALLAAMTGRPFRVIIAGEGGQRAELAALIASLYVERFIELVGRRTPEQVRALYWQADCAVFPSLYETTPITLLEAWAVGLPVIMTPVGIGRQSTPAVYTVPLRDEYAIAAALKTLLKDADQRHALAQAGQQHAQAYLWPHIATQSLGLYETAMI